MLCKYFVPFYLSVLFMVSFAIQKLLSFIRSHVFIFVSIFITLGDGSKKILLSELLFQRSNFGIEIKGNKMLWRMANTTTACRTLLIWRADQKKKLKVVLWKYKTALEKNIQPWLQVFVLRNKPSLFYIIIYIWFTFKGTLFMYSLPVFVCVCVHLCILLSFCNL